MRPRLKIPIVSIGITDKVLTFKILLDIMHLKCIISTKEIMHEPNLYHKIVGAGPQKGCR